MKILLPINILLFFTISCTSQSQRVADKKVNVQKQPPVLPANTSYDSSFKTIHVLVALCDNKYQGIVPVPAKIGNGQDLDNNLYWGCSFGIRSYFKNSKQWKLIRQYPVDSLVLERLVFKNLQHDYYLVADAFNGKYIKQCTIDFFNSCSGRLKDTIQLKEACIGINGNAALIAYIGHDGLMDFSLNESFNNADQKKRDAIVLACISKKYFAQHLAETRANPLVWTTGLMCPEAYTLHDALETYINGKQVESIGNSAAKAYAKYQKCSVKAASNLLVSGW